MLALELPSKAFLASYYLIAGYLIKSYLYLKKIASQLVSIRLITDLLVFLLYLLAINFTWVAKQSVAQVNQPATRVISLSPHLTENLFSIGAGHLLVGAVEPLDYPAAAQQLFSLGRYNQINLEEVLALQPDLVVAWQAGHQALLTRLQELGIKVVISNPLRLEDIANELIKLGQLTGLSQQANEVAQNYLADLNQLTEDAALANQSPKKVFYQLGGRPIFTLNNQHFISQAIEICGGHNVFGQLKQLAPQINLEEILLANPEVIFIAGKGKQAVDEQAFWQKFSSVTAVKKEQVYLLNPDLLQRPTLRVVEGIKEMCGYLN